MKHANFVALGSVCLLALLALLFSKSPTPSSEGDIPELGLQSNHVNSVRSAHPPRPNGKISTVTNDETKAGDSQLQIEENREQLERLLTHSEEHLTYEILDDGTELVHMNRSNGHFSAASIGENGEVTVNCHSNFNRLEEQGTAASETRIAKVLR